MNSSTTITTTVYKADFKVPTAAERNSDGWTVAEKITTELSVSADGNISIVLTY